MSISEIISVHINIPTHIYYTKYIYTYTKYRQYNINIKETCGSFKCYWITMEV